MYFNHTDIQELHRSVENLINKTQNLISYEFKKMAEDELFLERSTINKGEMHLSSFGKRLCKVYEMLTKAGYNLDQLCGDLLNDK